MRKDRVFWGPAVLTALFLCFSCESKFDDSPSDLPLFGAAPHSVQITARNGALVAQWTKVASAQGVAPSYLVYYGAGADPGKAEKYQEVFSNTSNLVIATIEPLTNYQTYYVWVKSVFGELGASDYSPTVSGMPVPAPGTPGRITVTGGDTILDLKWDPVPDAFTYNIFYKAGSYSGEPPADASVAPAVSAAGAIIFNLNNNADYTVWVQAENTAGKSGFKQGGGAPVLSGGLSPPVITAVTGGNRKLIITWDQVPGVPEYVIFYNASDNSAGASRFHSPIPADAPAVTAELTGLTNAREYYVWVASANSAESSGLSPSRSGTPQAAVSIKWSDPNFVLGRASAEYLFAQDVPPSVFFPEGRPFTDRLPRVQESALGNLFTDGAAWYVREALGEQIDFVFLNGSFIDNVLSQGAIRLGALAGIVQADGRADKLCLLTLTGAQMKEFFGVTSGDTPAPNSVAAVTHMGRGGHDTGNFGMVSKEIRYTIEYPKSPSLPGPELKNEDADRYWHGRIKAGTLKFNGRDIEDDRKYRICTTDYNASGVYYVILATAGADKKVIDTLFYRAVAEYIYDKQIVTPKLDGRIKLEGGVPLPPPWVNSSWNPYGN
ncbi:MAG: 5'-nucleotidase C-terminal domain-containing protein [Treponema sp.]|jgi:hypothetical protein|nr:5'-nucleotidase C-terminal domain-containing protein [Treponema sp.]